MTIPLFPSDEASTPVICATFSPDRTHRYSWSCSSVGTRGEACGSALFIMLNPSTADEWGPDPTVRRCIGFARAWGYMLLQIRNLFSLRSTDPRALYGAANPEGDPENLDRILYAARENADIVVCAWGVHGALRGRGAAVAAALRAQGTRLHYLLGLTKNGHPCHPLYLRGDVKPTLWEAW